MFGWVGKMYFPCTRKGIKMFGYFFIESVGFIGNVGCFLCVLCVVIKESIIEWHASWNSSSPAEDFTVTCKLRHSIKEVKGQSTCSTSPLTYRIDNSQRNI